MPTNINFLKASFCSPTGELIQLFNNLCENKNGLESGIIKRVAALAIIVFAIFDSIIGTFCVVLYPLTLWDKEEEGEEIRRYAKNLTGSLSTLFYSLTTIFTGSLPGIHYSLHGEGIGKALKEKILVPMQQIESNISGYHKPTDPQKVQIFTEQTTFLSENKTIFSKIMSELRAEKDTIIELESLFQTLAHQITKNNNINCEIQTVYIKLILQTLNDKKIEIPEKIVISALESEHVCKIILEYDVNPEFLKKDIEKQSPEIRALLVEKLLKGGMKRDDLNEVTRNETDEKHVYDIIAGML